MLRMFPAAIVFLLLLASCGKPGGDFTYRTDKNESKIFIERKAMPGKTAFEIAFTSGTVPLETAAVFCIGALERFRVLSRPYDPAQGTVRIGPEGDLYRVFFQLGIFSLPELKNSLLRSGFIQTQWRQWAEESSEKHDPVSVLLAGERHNLFRIPEFKNLLALYVTNRLDRDQVYPYAASYLLKKVLFISLQEILSRPYRYDQPREADTVFSQVVILPEAVAFVGYLTDKYGYRRTLLAAKNEFSTNSWKNLIGEDFHDTEGDFTARLEERKFDGVFGDPEFLGKLDALLETYNKMTKSTLFRK